MLVTLGKWGGQYKKKLDILSIVHKFREKLSVTKRPHDIDINFTKKWRTAESCIKEEELIRIQRRRAGYLLRSLL